MHFPITEQMFRDWRDPEDGYVDFNTKDESYDNCTHTIHKLNDGGYIVVRTIDGTLDRFATKAMKHGQKGCREYCPIWEINTVLIPEYYQPRLEPEFDLEEIELGRKLVEGEI